jgi:hypothetical protein
MQDFDFIWFCRVVEPITENYTKFDEDGMPGATPGGEPIPEPHKATPINSPPGNFEKN